MNYPRIFLKFKYGLKIRGLKINNRMHDDKHFIDNSSFNEYFILNKRIGVCFITEFPSFRYLKNGIR